MELEVPVWAWLMHVDFKILRDTNLGVTDRSISNQVYHPKAYMQTTFSFNLMKLKIASNTLLTGGLFLKPLSLNV